MLLSSTVPFGGRKPNTPKTPGRLPRPATPRVTQQQRKAIGEALSLSDAYAPLDALTPPQFQMPARPSLYSPNTPQLRISGFDGFTPRLERTGESDRARYESALRGSLPPTQGEYGNLQNTARLRGLSAGRGTLDQFLDTDPSQEGIQLRPYSPYTPPALPNREFAEYPGRQQVTPDRLSMALAAIGGLLAPTQAGYFASAPLQSAQAQSEQNWQDALNEYRVRQWMADQQYGDALRGRESQIETDLYNRQGLQNQDALMRDIGFRLSPLDQQEAEASYLQTQAGTLTRREGEAQQQGLEAGLLQERMAEGLRGNQERLSQYGAEVQGAVQGYEAQQKAYMDNLKLQADLGNQRAQRLLDLMRLQDTSAYRQGMLGLGQQNAATRRYQAETGRYSAETGRLNAETAQRRLAFDAYKLRFDPNGDIDAVVEKDLQVSRAYERLQQAQDRYNGLTMGTAGQTPAPEYTEEGGVFGLGKKKIRNPQWELAEKSVRDAEKALDRIKREVWNRKAALMGIPPLPEPNAPAKRDKSGAVIPNRIQPPQGATSMGGVRINK